MYNSKIFRFPPKVKVENLANMFVSLIMHSNLDDGVITDRN